MSTKLPCESCARRAGARRAAAQQALYAARLQMVVLLLARREPRAAQTLADRIGDDLAPLRAEARELRRRVPPAELAAELARQEALCVDHLRAYEADAVLHDSRGCLNS